MLFQPAGIRRRSIHRTSPCMLGGKARENAKTTLTMTSALGAELPQGPLPSDAIMRAWRLARGNPKTHLDDELAVGRRGAAHGGDDAGDKRPGGDASAAERHARGLVLQHERVVVRDEAGRADQRPDAAVLFWQVCKSASGPAPGALTWTGIAWG